MLEGGKKLVKNCQKPDPRGQHTAIALGVESVSHWGQEAGEVTTYFLLTVDDESLHSATALIKGIHQ